MRSRLFLSCLVFAFALVALSFPAGAENRVVNRALNGIKITRVVYRVAADHSKFIDVTEFVNKIFESGTKSLFLTTREAADNKAPDPTQKKEFVFTYTYAGQHKEKVFAEGTTLHFQKDLK